MFRHIYIGSRHIYTISVQHVKLLNLCRKTLNPCVVELLIGYELVLVIKSIQPCVTGNRLALRQSAWQARL
jgi:hypothetical protein